MPDIVDGPVIERGGGIGVLELLGDPALFSITVFFIQNAAVPLPRFIGADAQQTDGFLLSMREPVPAAKLLGQVLLINPILVGRYGVVL